MTRVLPVLIPGIMIGAYGGDSLAHLFSEAKPAPDLRGSVNLDGYLGYPGRPETQGLPGELIAAGLMYPWRTHLEDRG